MRHIILGFGILFISMYVTAYLMPRGPDHLGLKLLQQENVIELLEEENQVLREQVQVLEKLFRRLRTDMV
jgi:hypothetical protein